MEPKREEVEANQELYNSNARLLASEMRCAELQRRLDDAKNDAARSEEAVARLQDMQADLHGANSIYEEFERLSQSRSGIVPEMGRDSNEIRSATEVASLLSNAMIKAWVSLDQKACPAPNTSDDDEACSIRPDVLHTASLRRRQGSAFAMWQRAVTVRRSMLHRVQSCAVQSLHSCTIRCDTLQRLASWRMAAFRASREATLAMHQQSALVRLGAVAKAHRVAYCVRPQLEGWHRRASACTRGATVVGRTLARIDADEQVRRLSVWSAAAKGARVAARFARLSMERVQRCQLQGAVDAMRWGFLRSLADMDLIEKLKHQAREAEKFSAFVTEEQHTDQGAALRRLHIAEEELAAERAFQKPLSAKVEELAKCCAEQVGKNAAAHRTLGGVASCTLKKTIKTVFTSVAHSKTLDRESLRADMCKAMTDTRQLLEMVGEASSKLQQGNCMVPNMEEYHRARDELINSTQERARLRHSKAHATPCREGSVPRSQREGSQEPSRAHSKPKVTVRASLPLPRGLQAVAGSDGSQRTVLKRRA